MKRLIQAFAIGLVVMTAPFALGASANGLPVCSPLAVEPPCVHHSNRVVVLRADPAHDSGFDERAALRQFRDYYTDVFHWIFFVSSSSRGEDYLAAFYRYCNAVYGIGLDVRDLSGCGPTLKGIIHFYRWMGPSYGGQTAAYAHEIMHTWGQYWFRGTSARVLGGASSHWGPCIGVGPGVLGGFDPEHMIDLTLRAPTFISTREKYSTINWFANRYQPHELYLAGWMTAAELAEYGPLQVHRDCWYGDDVLLPPTPNEENERYHYEGDTATTREFVRRVRDTVTTDRLYRAKKEAEGVESYRVPLELFTTHTAARVELYDVARIEDEFGPRRPARGRSTFRSATVVLVHGADRVEPARLDHLASTMHAFQHGGDEHHVSFREWTWDRASLSTRMDCARCMQRGVGHKPYSAPPRETGPRMKRVGCGMTAPTAPWALATVGKQAIR